MRLRTVYGRQQWLILETIPTPRFQSYEAGHWSTERSKTPRPLSAPDSARPHAAYSTESTAGVHSRSPTADRWSPTAERIRGQYAERIREQYAERRSPGGSLSEAGQTADEPFFPLFHPFGPGAVSARPRVSSLPPEGENRASPVQSLTFQARSVSQIGGGGQTVHDSFNQQHQASSGSQRGGRDQTIQASFDLPHFATRKVGEAREEVGKDTPFFPLFSNNSPTPPGSPFVSNHSPPSLSATGSPGDPVADKNGMVG
jgi:hypothetical protein